MPVRVRVRVRVFVIVLACCCCCRCGLLWLLCVVVVVVEEGEEGGDKPNHVTTDSSAVSLRIAETEQLYQAQRMIGGIGNVWLSTYSQTENG